VDNKAKAGNAVDSQQANQPDSQAKVANKVKVVSAVDNRRVSQSCSPVKVVSREFLRILGRNQ
jgi:hypothetical protein